MGQFSWLDCLDDTQILNDVNENVYVLVPKEFHQKYGEQIVENCYDGYGHFGNYDAYELIFEWNRKYLTSDNLKRHDTDKINFINIVKNNSDDYITEVCEQYGYSKNSWKRELGIDVGCYDEQNESLRYPFKVTHHPGVPYEIVNASKSDFNQGWLLEEDEIKNEY